MNRLRPIAMLVALVVIVAAGSLLVAAVLGMEASEVAHLAGLLLPAIAVTVASATLASWLLRRTSLAQRYLAVAAVGTLVALGNLAVLAFAMLVPPDAATALAVVLLYASGAGLAAAFAAARSSAAALGRVARTAEILGEGDLAARVGELDGGPELDRLARTIDRMADRFQEVRDQEQRIERTRHDLITAVSHDLRTPLANLRAMVEAIDDGVVEDPPSLHRYVAEMRRETGLLSSLVDDLFELVRIDAVDIDADADRARLDHLVASAVATVEAEAERKGVHVSTDIGGTDDAMCSPYLVRVLQNLLGNAVRHTPSDGSVRLEGRRAARWLRLVVEDTGEGIAEADLPFVFDPFYRADTARSGDGAGLGLALAERIVRALGGRIEVTSASGRGARFALVVPLGPASPVSRAGAAPGSPRTRSGDRPGSGSPRPS